jgi:predicted DNA-binding transcriptional regulator AlpA
MADQSQLLTTAEAATYLRMAAHTLTRWRSQGKGPSFVRVGGSVFYRVTELEAYIERSVTAPEKRA